MEYGECYIMLYLLHGCVKQAKNDIHYEFFFNIVKTVIHFQVFLFRKCMIISKLTLHALTTSHS